VEMLDLMETRCLPRLLDDLTPAPEESMLRCCWLPSAAKCGRLSRAPGSTM
jgi:hypothetical protein